MLDKFKDSKKLLNLITSRKNNKETNDALISVFIADVMLLPNVLHRFDLFIDMHRTLFLINTFPPVNGMSELSKPGFSAKSIEANNTPYDNLEHIISDMPVNNSDNGKILRLDQFKVKTDLYISNEFELTEKQFNSKKSIIDNSLFKYIDTYNQIYVSIAKIYAKYIIDSDKVRGV
jgi:hypothetical protein